MNDGSAAPERRIVVLGVGNLLWADEGFGVRCVEALGEGWSLPEDVAITIAGLVLGFVIALFLKETAPRRVG